MPGDRFWYRSVTSTGADLIVVDPAKGSRTVVFDAPPPVGRGHRSLPDGHDGGRAAAAHHPERASAGRRAHGQRHDCRPPGELPDVETTRCGEAVESDRELAGAGGRGGGRGGRGGGGVAGGRGGRGAARAPETLSPDGKRAAFIRDWEFVGLRDVATKR